VFNAKETAAINLAVAKVEAVCQAHAVAVVLVNPRGELQVLLSPGNELAAWEACASIDWQRVRPIVEEFSGH